jgi:hypothetical protein
MFFTFLLSGGRITGLIYSPFVSSGWVVSIPACNVMPR